MNLLDKIEINPNIKLSLDVKKKDDVKPGEEDIQLIHDAIFDMQAYTEDTADELVTCSMMGKLDKGKCMEILDSHNEEILGIIDNDLTDNQRRYIESTGGYVENYKSRHGWS